MSKFWDRHWKKQEFLDGLDEKKERGDDPKGPHPDGPPQSSETDDPKGPHPD